jgi:hypothetical protein
MSKEKTELINKSSELEGLVKENDELISIFVKSIHTAKCKM